MADDNILDDDVDLNLNLDDLPELAGYVQLFTGAYVMVAEKGIELVEMNDKNFFKLELTVKSIEELEEKPTEKEPWEPKVGDIQTFLFQRNHRIALGNFRKFWVPDVAKKFNCSTIAEVIENYKGLEFLVVGKRKYNKETDQYNFNPKTVNLV